LSIEIIGPAIQIAAILAYTGLVWRSISSDVLDFAVSLVWLVAELPLHATQASAVARLHLSGFSPHL
jgi:hypothetical protein